MKRSFHHRLLERNEFVSFAADNSACASTQFGRTENSLRACHVIVVGGGFSGLAAAYQLVVLGVRVTVIEKDGEVGGLAGSFATAGEPLEKFYHHWFTSDRDICALIQELGCTDRIVYRATRTGAYYAHRLFRLSSPADLLRFNQLKLKDRIRLGLMTLKTRRVRDWQSLEGITAEEWLRKLCGSSVYEMVWEPLLRGKFGSSASEVSAVWIWNKLKLRGGSRGWMGREMLGYYRGGFGALANRIAAEICRRGGQIRTNTLVTGTITRGNRLCGVKIEGGEIEADAVIFTASLPVVAALLGSHVPDDYLAKLERIKYLGNICLVLELVQSLSQTYWMNVGDPSFPFVGVIEHTNFEPASSYDRKHVVYLSKYLPTDSDLYHLSDRDFFEYCIPYLQQMFPAFDQSWIVRFHVWRAPYAQPVVVRNYSQILPSVEMPLAGGYLCTMAQVYPEDRGTNYAVRAGRAVARKVAAVLESSRCSSRGR